MSANGHAAPDLHAAHRLLGPRKPDGGSFTEMTLRDFFAAKALTGLVGNQLPANAAICAYQFADAMLAERDKRGAEPTP